MRKIILPTELGWDNNNLTCNLNVISVDGDHDTMMTDPKNRALLGKKINKMSKARSSKQRHFSYKSGAHFALRWAPALSSIRNIGIFFGFLKIPPFLLDTIDGHGSMVMFAILNMLRIIYVVTVLKETNGQSLDDVVLYEKISIENVRARNISIGYELQNWK